MSTVLSYGNAGKSYSYQHLQGVMLSKLNKIASELNLSHSEYRIMGVLIGLWNMKKGMAFPTISYLAKTCHMGRSTIINALERLVEVHLLIVIRTKGKRNNYYLTEMLLNNNSDPAIETPCSLPCKTTHDSKHIKIKNLKEHNALNNTISNISDYSKIIDNLNEWNYLNPKQLIKKYGLEKITQLIKEIKNKNPVNKGAYLRTIIKQLDIVRPGKTDTVLTSKQPPLIEQMLQTNYWKHLPTQKIYQVKPKVGNHLLIRFNKNENTITLLENNLTDMLDNFIVSDTVAFELQNKNLSKEHFSKELLFKSLQDQGCLQELKVLNKIIMKASKQH